MRQGGWTARPGWGIVLAAVLLAGCSTTGGNRLTLFPEGHPLTEEAKAMRAAAPEPLPLPRELNKHVLPPYTVEPGDVLLVQPADLDSPIRLPGDQPVLTDGTINLGRYGQLVVAGKTVPEIEADIRAQVQTYLASQPRRPARPADNRDLGAEPRLPEPGDVGPITVRIVTRVSKVYYVLGEVNAPGSFVLNGRETVLDGILAAGGLTDRGSRRNIILSRPTQPDSCRVVLPICYNQIVQLGDTSTNYQLAPGDRIYVPTRTCWEDLFRKKPECPPCNRPQVPCTAVQPLGCGGDGTPPPSHFFGIVPHFTLGEPAREAPPGAAEQLPAPQPAAVPEARPGSVLAPVKSGANALWQRMAAAFELN
jgi:protein involved in polysaccharide export with SLBB domain